MRSLPLKTLPQDVTFDSLALLEMHRASRRRALEVTLARFNVSVSVISMYRYLSAKAYLKRNVERELEVLKDLYITLPLDDEVLSKAAMTEAKLLRKGIMMDLEEVLAGTSAIVHRTLLVTPDVERYKPLVEYGLDVMSLGKFLKEVERMVKEELEKG